jgi:hypothetical protein
MNITVDPNRPFGLRVVDVQMLNPETNKWEPIDSKKKYYMCLPKYVPPLDISSFFFLFSALETGMI